MSFSYAEALTREIRDAAPKATADTIYIGGGTPTYIDAALICNIMDAIKSDFRLPADCEITVECNPGTADAEKLRALKECGINRLSIGLQSDNDKILKTLGRIHNYAEFEACLCAARDAGFDNISVDLMYGLPGQTRELWRSALRRITALPIDHISAYALKIEPGTTFYTMHERGRLILPDDDLIRDMYDDCVGILAENGFKRYEISNFARDSKPSRHNMKYWTGGDYIGFGAGAVSRIGNTIYSNVRGVAEYITEINKNGSAVNPDSIITNSDTDTMSEYVFLALRLDKGISKAEFENKFGKDIYEVFGEPLRRHIDITQVMTDMSGYIRIKPEYIYVSNAIMADFV